MAMPLRGGRVKAIKQKKYFFPTATVAISGWGFKALMALPLNNFFCGFSKKINQILNDISFQFNIC